MSLVLDLTVKELVEGKKKLVFVDADDALDKALQLLRDHNIVAVPVRAAAQQQQQEPIERASRPQQDDDSAALGGKVRVPPLHIIGMLSVVDVAAYLARNSLSKAEGAGVEVDTGKLQVRDVMRRTEESRQMLVLDPHATVGRAMEYLGSRGFHRALVPNLCLEPHAAGHVPLPSTVLPELQVENAEYRVLSQIDLVAFLLQHEGMLGLSLAQSVDSLGLGPGPVVGATPDMKLGDALARMYVHSVTAVAVVENVEAGNATAASGSALLDTLSASDLRACSAAELSAANRMLVKEYLAKQRGADAAPMLLTCTQSTSVRAVMKMMVEARMHRVWVVSQEQRPDGTAYLQPNGVVTLSDVIRVLRVLPVTNPAVAELLAEKEEAAKEGSEESTPVDAQFFDAFMWLDWFA